MALKVTEKKRKKIKCGKKAAVKAERDNQQAMAALRDIEERAIWSIAEEKQKLDLVTEMRVRLQKSTEEKKAFISRQMLQHMPQNN